MGRSECFKKNRGGGLVSASLENWLLGCVKVERKNNKKKLDQEGMRGALSSSNWGEIVRKKRAWLGATLLGRGWTEPKGGEESGNRNLLLGQAKSREGKLGKGTKIDVEEELRD